MPVPKTREALFVVIANAIGWGATPDDVEGVAEELEAQGVSFVPTALIPAGAVNPYAPEKK